MALRDFGCPILITTLFVLFVGECSGREQKKFVMDEADIPTILGMLTNLTRKVETLEKETQLLRHQPISFMAYLSKSIPGQNHQIIFDDAKVNIGNAYHATHGNFIAPIDGLYQFAITACSLSNHYVVLELTINSVVVDRVLAGDDAYSDCNTGVFLQRVSAGDDVYVQHEAVGDYLLSESIYGRPSFSGVLLSAM